MRKVTRMIVASALILLVLGMFGCEPEPSYGWILIVNGSDSPIMEAYVSEQGSANFPGSSPAHAGSD